MFMKIFMIDLRGIFEYNINFSVVSPFQVSAVDVGSGNRNNIEIVNNRYKLTSDDIERTVRSANEHADEDEKMRDRVKAKNELGFILTSVKSQLRDMKQLGKVNKISF